MITVADFSHVKAHGSLHAEVIFALDKFSGHANYHHHLPCSCYVTQYSTCRSEGFELSVRTRSKGFKYITKGILLCCQQVQLFCGGNRKFSFVLWEMWEFFCLKYLQQQVAIEANLTA